MMNSTINLGEQSRPRYISFLPKITVPFILLSVITIAVHTSKSSHKVEANLLKIINGQVWRVFTAIFGSQDIYRMFMNIIWLLILSKLSESRKGSFPYLCDIMVKGIFINCFSSLLFQVVMGLSHKIGWIFNIILQAQERFSYSGYGVIVLMEVFLLMSAPNPVDMNGNILSKPYIWPLRIFYVVLSIIYIPYSQAFGAGVMGILIKWRVFDCCERLQKSTVNFKLDKILRHADKFFYFYTIDEKDKQYFDNNESITIVSNTTLKVINPDNSFDEKSRIESQQETKMSSNYNSESIEYKADDTEISNIIDADIQNLDDDKKEQI